MYSADKISFSRMYIRLMTKHKLERVKTWRRKMAQAFARAEFSVAKRFSAAALQGQPSADKSFS